MCDVNILIYTNKYLLYGISKLKIPKNCECCGKQFEAKTEPHAFVPDLALTKPTMQEIKQNEKK
jgi:hypothetical protein